MNQDQAEQNLSKIYAWGFPINLTLEILLQFASLIIPVFLVFKAIQTNNVIAISLSILLSLYIYPLTILLLGALTIRFLPKPNLGELKAPADKLKFQILVAFNNFIRRTPARWLMIFPFPAYYFYKIAGAKIDVSVIQTSPDTIPDVDRVSIGKNTLLGWNCIILGHFVPDAFTTIVGKVKIGDNVLIGESSTIWCNVKIGNNVIIQSKSVVLPGTIIPSNEVWGGVPAKKIRTLTREDKNQAILLNFASIDEVEKDLQNYFQINYSIDEYSHDKSLLSMSLSAEDIARLLNKLEKKYQIFIDRTEINLSQLSFNQILSIIKKQIIPLGNK